MTDGDRIELLREIVEKNAKTFEDWVHYFELVQKQAMAKACIVAAAANRQVLIDTKGGEGA